MKMHRTRFMRLWAMLLSVLVTVGLAPVTAFAAGAVDTNKTDCSITIHYMDEDTPISGAPFRLYKVADIDPSGYYTPVAPYNNDEKYPLTWNNDTPWNSTTTKTWESVAGTLAAYIASNKPKPDARGKTNRKGELTFKDLSTGLYLLVGDEYLFNGTYYTPTPYFVSLPSRHQTSEQSDEWVYDVEINPKHEAWTPVTPPPPTSSSSTSSEPASSEPTSSEPTSSEPTSSEPTSSEPTSSNPSSNPGSGDQADFTVVKVWDDTGKTSSRPKSVTMQLLKDGQLYDTVTLNADNNWRHTWKGLDRKYMWQVVETTVPSGYTVCIDREGTAFVVTNTAKGTGSSSSSNKPPVTPTTPNGNNGGGGNGNGNGGGSKLPQTGMLWWPVPVLAAAGMVVFVIGWSRRRRQERADTSANEE